MMKINDKDDKALDRSLLYDEVWAEPMTHVAPRYSLSDTGLRKACKSLDIPLPPFGYWAKKRAGKPVAERPSLPPPPVSLDTSKTSETTTPKERLQKRRANLLELRDADMLSMEQLLNIENLDILTDESRTNFEDWCKKQSIPERTAFYHD